MLLLKLPRGWWVRWGGEVCHVGGCGNPPPASAWIARSGSSTNPLLKPNQTNPGRNRLCVCANLFTDELCVNRQTTIGYSRLVTTSWINRVRAHFLCKCGYEELSLVDGILTAHTHSHTCCTHRLGWWPSRCAFSLSHCLLLKAQLRLSNISAPWRDLPPPRTSQVQGTHRAHPQTGSSFYWLGLVL